MANTYATWDPSDKSANMTLSNGNLTGTNAGAAAWVGTRATITKSSGKWYWEITLGQTTNAVGTINGVSTLTRALNSNLNSEVIAYLTGQGGYKLENGSETSGQGEAVVTDIVGCAWDADAGTIAIYVNNTLKFTAGTMTGTNAALFQAFILNDAITANFGATALAYTPPTGFNAGLYTAAVTDTGNLILLGVGK